MSKVEKINLIGNAHNVTNEFPDCVFKSGDGSDQLLHPVHLGPELFEAAGLQQVVQILKNQQRL